MNSETIEAKKGQKTDSLQVDSLQRHVAPSKKKDVGDVGAEDPVFSISSSKMLGSNT